METGISITGGILGALLFQIPRGDIASTFGIIDGKAFIFLCREALAKPGLKRKGVRPVRVCGLRGGGLFITVPGADGADPIGVTIYDAQRFIGACEAALVNPTITEQILAPKGHA